jgi:hypothetical protein
MYVLQGAAGFSHIQGDSNAISLAQRSSARYWQRPDARAYHFDPSRTAFNGYNTNISVAKNAGKHWIGGFYASQESPGFEINDAGRLATADGNDFGANIRYRETQPNKYFRNYGITFSPSTELNFDRDMQFGELYAAADATFKNFWGMTLTAFHDARAQDERLTRGGPSMGYGYYNVGIVNLFNSSASKTRWNARVYYGKDEFGSPTNRISGSLAMRPSPRWSFSAAPNYLRAVSSRQFITSFSGGSAATYGRRYVFSFIDQSQLFAELRLNYTLKPDVTLEVYGQPFAASGRFYDFGELDAARSRNLRHYGKDGTTIVQQSNGRYLVTDTNLLTNGAPTTFTLPNPDFNVRSFRSNVVLRWEYRPGSTLYLVWQEDRSGSEAQGSLVQLNDLFGAFQNAGNNYIAIKASFWIPVR